jgi:hypothetical protein
MNYGAPQQGPTPVTDCASVKWCAWTIHASRNAFILASRRETCKSHQETSEEGHTLLVIVGQWSGHMRHCNPRPGHIPGVKVLLKRISKSTPKCTPFHERICTQFSRIKLDCSINAGHSLSRTMSPHTQSNTQLSPHAYQR